MSYIAVIQILTCHVKLCDLQKCFDPDQFCDLDQFCNFKPCCDLDRFCHLVQFCRLDQCYDLNKHLVVTINLMKSWYLTIVKLGKEVELALIGAFKQETSLINLTKPG